MKFIISHEELKEMLKSVAKLALDESDPIIDDLIFAFALSHNYLVGEVHKKKKLT